MILFINAGICFAIAVRLFLFQRGKNHYKLFYALIAWGILCSSASVAILIISNHLKQAQEAQTFMNLLILICMLKTKGNVAQFIFPLFSTHKTTNTRQTKRAKTS